MKTAVNTIADTGHDADLFDELSKPDQEILSQILEQYLIDLENGIKRDAGQLVANYPQFKQRLANDSQFDQKLRDYFKSIELLVDATGELDSGSNDQQRDADNLRQLGDFQIGREIGRGGMGVVYEATQESLGRRVALKVLPFAAVLDKRQIARFQNEAQAAAQLHHPNIVPVYSVGCDRGVHYYSMQYIDGQSLDKVIEQSLKWSQEPGKSTELADPDATTAAYPTFATDRSAQTNEYVRSVVQITIQAAMALDHAHAFGIVHRDVKPSNLMIDGDGQLWVTDFGLARCQSNSKITMTGDIIGTLRYMSPEAARGRNALVDHLTDIYSLGITLYELLTLRPAHAGSDRNELLDNIRDVEPPSARKLNPAIPLDLETILNKAISKSRDDRYDSAKAFADDLQRFLDGKPTLAKRPSVIDRAAKWASRHKRAVVLAAATLIIVSAAAMTTAGLLQHEQSKTKSALAMAQSNYQQSQANLGKAIEVVDRFGMRVASQLVGIPGAEKVRRDILRATLEDYRQLAKQFENDSKMSFALALCNTQIAAMHRGLGELDLAQKHLTRAVDLYAAMDMETFASLGAISSDRVLLDHAVSHNNLGEVHYQLGDLKSAEKDYQRTLSLTNAASAFTSKSPPKVSRIRSAAMVNLGNLYRSTGRTDESLSVYRDALQIQNAVHQSQPSNADVSRELAVSLAQLAFLNADRDLSAASDYNQQAIEIHRRLVNENPDDLIALSELSTCFNHRGRIFHQQDDDAEAQKAYQESIEVQKRLVARAPSVTRFHEQLAVAHNNLGQMLCSNKNTASVAVEHFRSAQQILTELTQKAPKAPHYAAQLGGALGNLAPMLESSDPAAAQELYQQAIDHQEQAVKRAPKIADFRRWLSSNYFKCAKFHRSQNQFDLAGDLAIKRSQLWADDSEHQFRVAVELAETASAANKQSETASRWADVAVAHLNKAIDLGLSDGTRRVKHVAFDRLQTHPDFPTQVNK